MEIVQAPERDAVRQLLTASGLPASDLETRHMAHFFACVSGDRLDGVVGLEPYGEVGLLRSLAVAGIAGGGGLGSRLVARVEAYARSLGVGALYLLTTSAEAFFRRRGYEALAREQAPAPIQGTREFAALCPAGSVLMVKRL